MAPYGATFVTSRHFLPLAHSGPILPFGNRSRPLSNRYGDSVPVPVVVPINHMPKDVLYSPDMTHLSAVPSTILSFHIVRIGDAPVFPADEALRSSRTFAPTKDLLSICLHSIFPCQFSISAFHTRFSKRKRQLLTRTTPPPLTPSFLCHGSTPF